MPHSSIVNLHYAKSERASVPLSFIARRHNGTQAATRDRIVLEPEIDLARYEFSAVVDWIDITVAFARQTQFRYVQDVLLHYFPRVCHVKAIDPFPGASADRFSFRVQEPRSVAIVLDCCRALAGKFGEASAPLVNAIEISVDAKPKEHDDHDRALLLGVMQRTIFTSRDIVGPNRSRPRHHISKTPVFLFPTSRSESRRRDIWLHSTEDNPAPLDSTLSLGAVDDPVMVKLMDKVVDRQNQKTRTFHALDDADKRVRIEVTLDSRALVGLGIRELIDLKNFSYVALQGDYFQFKLPTFQDLQDEKAHGLRAIRRELEQRRLKRFLSTGVIGLMFRQYAEKESRSSHLPELKRQFRRDGRKMRRNRRGSGTTDTLVAYEKLNRVVSAALWNLSKREKTAWARLESR